MPRPLFTSGNNFPSPEFEVGGSKPIYYYIGKELPGGFNPDLSAFPKGSVVQTGTPIQVDEATRQAKVHVAVKVYEAASSGATSVKVAKLKGGSVLSAGQNVVVAPATIAGTGTGYAIASVDSTNAAYDVLTLGAALGANLAEGAILVEASAAGAGATIKVIPNALTRFDIYVDPTSTQFTCGAVVEATVYDRRIPPVAQVVKDLFQKEITFSQSK